MIAAISAFGSAALDSWSSVILENPPRARSRTQRIARRRLHVTTGKGEDLRSGIVSFHVGCAPSREEIASVAERVEKGMTRWLKKRKLTDERPIEERSCEASELSDAHFLVTLRARSAELRRHAA